MIPACKGVFFMKKCLYKQVIYFSQLFGRWFFHIFAWFVAAGYFLFFPLRVAAGVKFYRALFPEQSFVRHLLCVWRQYHNFTNVFLDRFFYEGEDAADFTKEGWEYLQQAMAGKSGAVIVMSHVGNWELAVQKLNLQGLPIMLYLGKKHKEQIERIQKEALTKSGVKIVTTAVDESSPFAMIEGLNFLRAGGIVSLTGDRLWGNQRSVTVEFLGHEAHLPDIPHVLAMMSGAPLFHFFIFRTGAKKYHVVISRGRYVKADSRSDRHRAVWESAQIYADDLAKVAREHYDEWYHFEPFLGQKSPTQKNLWVAEKKKN